MVGKAILNAVDDSNGTQLLKLTILKDETIEDLEKMHDFGFTSHPPPDETTESLVIFPNANRDMGIVIASHNRDLRPTDLEEGASCLYGMDSAGSNTNRITINPTDNEIKIENKQGAYVEIKGDDIRIENKDGAYVQLNGTEINIKNGTKINLLGATQPYVLGSAFQTLFNAHTHTGVTAGPGVTGTTATPMTAAQLSSKIKGE